jgi:geranylgeranyl reductase family protein
VNARPPDDRTRDVIVVGAGPAGAAAAALLARRGHDVLLLDEARFPRDKVCGEGVSPESWRLLDLMGATGRVRALEPWPLRGMRLVSPGGTSFRGEYRGRERKGFAIRRLALDAALVETAREAGAEVHEGVRVSALLQGPDGVRGVTTASCEGASLPSTGPTLTARVVVGADGRRSVVARQLGLLREHPRLRRFAVRGYWDGVEGLEAFGEMHVAERAYCGVAPLSPRLANVAFVIDTSEMAAAGGDLEGFYRATLDRRWPALAERLSHATLQETPRAIGPLALECRGVCAPGAVLVGDAAGFYDPFTGEGVTLALRTAELAANAIDTALRARHGHDTLPCLDAYERERERATRDKFRFNRLLQLAVSHRAVAEAVAARLARRPDLADRLVGIAGDFVPARTAFGPRFLMDLLRA